MDASYKEPRECQFCKHVEVYTSAGELRREHGYGTKVFMGVATAQCTHNAPQDYNELPRACVGDCTPTAEEDALIDAYDAAYKKWHKAQRVDPRASCAQFDPRERDS